MIGRRFKPSTKEVDKPKGFDDFELRLGDLMRGERATLGKSLLDVQRELKIKATYIAAIENCDVSAFETQGFIAGYVRSYARYLGMDPDWAFQRFCVEANFTVAHGMSAAASSQSMTARRSLPEFSDPLGNPNATFIPRGESFLSRVEPGAVGSLAVLVLLIGAIGYGGWSVLNEVQRVQLAPVEQAPQVVAEVDPLAGAAAIAPLATETADAADAADVVRDPTELAADAPAPADLMDRLYRPQALDVPVLTARDGPIAAIDPRQTGTLAEVARADALATAVDATVADVVAAEAGNDVQVVAETTQLEILAVRPSWVRVQSADGTVLFEKILDAGERYAVPQLEEPPVLRAGNSGSVYFAVNGKTYGPASPGAAVVKNLALSAETLTQTFAEADISGDADLARFVDVAQAEGTAEAPPPVAD
jgi:cytoskeletal protein RodZ